MGAGALGVTDPAMQVRRDTADAQGTDMAQRLRFDSPPPPRACAMYKTAALIAMFVAAGCALAMSGVMTMAGSNRANQASGTSQDCSARYAALLDLAELARRDGKSSEVVVRGLSDRRGAMSDCLPMAQSALAKP